MARSGMPKAVAAAGVAAAAGVHRPLIPLLRRRSLSFVSLAQQLRFGDADPERLSRTRILRAARAPRPTALQCPLFASSSGRPSPCAHARYMALSSASLLSRSPRSCHASVAPARDCPPMEYALLTAPRSSFGPSSIAFCPLWSACRPWTYGVQLTLLLISRLCSRDPMPRRACFRVAHCPHYLPPASLPFCCEGCCTTHAPFLIGPPFHSWMVRVPRDATVYTCRDAGTQRRERT